MKAPTTSSRQVMKILFFTGWHAAPGGIKPTFLREHGHEVVDPALDDDDFSVAIRTAQHAYDEGQPEVVVGLSRGGAVAMNIDIGETPLVLMCPGWKRWGKAKTVSNNTVILHSRVDDVVPFAHSEELLRNSGLPESALIVVGNDHWLADPESLKAMLEACERSARKEEYHLPCCGMTSVHRLKGLPHVYGFDFDLFRCGRCAKPWVGFWCNAGGSGGWKPVTDADVEKMMVLNDSDLRTFVQEWAKDFN